MSNNQSVNNENFRFDVFISYRHSDLDSAAAAYLHKALENYKIPKEIQEKIGKQRINRVFRDEEELGASSDLFTEIENSIKASEYLVVILSPRYKQSKWCLKEIESFLKHRSRDNILAVIIEGEPYDVFPDILLEEGEPLALDIRAKDKKEMLKLARERLPRLVAPILGCTYDELYQRHRVYRMRRMAMLSGLVAAVSLVFGAVTIRQNIEINKNFIAKQENQSRYLAQTATDLLDSGDREAALLVALEALPKGSGDDSRPYVAEARIALENALYTYRMDYYNNLHPVKILEMAADSAYSTDYNRTEDVLLTVDTSGGIYVWECKTGNRLLQLADYPVQEARLTGMGSFIAKTADSLYCIDYTTGRLLWQWQYTNCDACYSTIFDWDYSPATGMVVCAATNMRWDEEITYTPDWVTEYRYYTSDAHRIHTIDAATGSVSRWKPEDMYANIGTGYANSWQLKDIAISPDGSQMALQLYNDRDTFADPGTNHIYVYPVNGGDAVYTAENEAYWALNHLYWYSDSCIISVYSPDTSISGMGMVENPFVWNADCHDISTGERLWSVTEKSMSITYSFDVQSFEAVNRSGETKQCIGITGGNVFVSIDRETGHIYNRIEDRSQIVMAQVLPNKQSMLLMTQDGFVFVTDPLVDKVYTPVLSSRTYYLNVGIVSQAHRFNDRTYVFNGSSIHWYQDNIDFNFTAMGTSPSYAGFSNNGQYMWFVDGKDTIHLYDVNEKKELHTDDAANIFGYDYNATLTADRYLVYPSAESSAVSVYDIQTATTADYPVDDIFNSRTKLYIGAISTQQTLVPAYVNTDLYGPGRTNFYNEQRTAHNLLWVKDITTGRDAVALTGQDIIQALAYGDRLYNFNIKSAMLSGDSNYLLLPCDVTLLDENGSQLPEKATMLVWDIAQGIWTSLPQEVLDVMPAGTSYYHQDGWILPGTSLVNMYGTDGSVKIVDIAAGQVLHNLDFGVVGSTEISFTPDGDHLILQDGGYHLKVYNWRTGEYTMEKTIAELSSLEFKFYNGGNLMSARLTVSRFISNNVQMFDLTQPGVYKLQNTISPCIACNGITTVIADNEYSRFYPYYSFDQLIEMAQDLLDGRQLTAAQRQTYLID